MKKIIIFSILLLTSSLALPMNKLGIVDRKELRESLRSIRIAVNNGDTQSAGREYNVQKSQLAQCYKAIETILDENQIPHPKERNFSWLYFLEIKSSEQDLSTDTEELTKRQALYDEAQRIMEDKK